MQDRPTLFIEIIQRHNHNVSINIIIKIQIIIKIIIIFVPGIWSWKFPSTF